jgi:hypothetical protein
VRAVTLGRFVRCFADMRLIEIVLAIADALYFFRRPRTAVAA